jgi:chromosome segregation ATPase
VWAHLGDAVQLTTDPGGARLAVRHEDTLAEVELPEAAAVELVDAVHSVYGSPLLEQINELGSALDATETERDELRDQLTDATESLRARLAEVEQLKTAVELADQLTRGHEAEVQRLTDAAVRGDEYVRALEDELERTRRRGHGLELDVERMRRAGLSVTERDPAEILAERRENESLT